MSDKSRKSMGRSREDASFPVPVGKDALPTDYRAVLDGLKERIQSERLRVTMSANSAMVLLYWDIGKTILERQQQQGWGAKIIDRLSHDLKTAFPDMSGFSPRNFKYMRKFADVWPEWGFVQQAAAQIPWFHNCLLPDAIPPGGPTPSERRSGRLSCERGAGVRIPDGTPDVVLLRSRDIVAERGTVE